MWHILVVDDEPEVREMMRLALEEEDDYRVGMARSLDEAVRVIEAARPDLLILDAVLPSAAGFPSRSSLEFVAFAVARAVPVIVMTGHRDLADALVEFGFPVLGKPFSVDHLEREAGAALARPKDNLRLVRNALDYLVRHREDFADLVDRMGRQGDEKGAPPRTRGDGA